MRGQWDGEFGTEARQRKASNRIPEGPSVGASLPCRSSFVPKEFPSGREWRSRLDQTGVYKMRRNEKKLAPYAVYLVEGEGDNALWTKIGAAWKHQDGKGFNIQLICLPLNGRLVIRETDAEAGR